MSEFTYVVSSTGLAERPEPVAQGCPRELLGLSCIASQYECLCQHVTDSAIEVTRTAAGEASALKLTLTLAPGASDLGKVMAALELTGYRPDFQPSRQTVVATFSLRRPQNTGLRLFVRETAI